MTAAGRRFLKYGRPTCTNGRILFFRIGNASRANGMTCRLVVSSWRKAGRSASSVGRRVLANGMTFVSVPWVWRSAAGSLDTASDRFCCWEANAWNTASEALTRVRISRSLLARWLVRSPNSWISCIRSVRR